MKLRKYGMNKAPFLIVSSLLLLSCVHPDGACSRLETKPQASLQLLNAQPNSIPSFEEKNGMVVIEAEHFAAQVKADIRRWYRFDKSSAVKHGLQDTDLPHPEGASGAAYIEVLPDTRTNHSEELQHGVNFSASPGMLGILSYPVYFNQAGRYYIWARAYSTGSEDNGLHFGINGLWPASAQRLQLCTGKNQWTWSSAQRSAANHCGSPLSLWIDIAQPGQHLLSVSMREDGFELDKIILTNNPDFTPLGIGPSETVYNAEPMPLKARYTDIYEYDFILNSADLFVANNASQHAIYHDKARDVLAINAVKTEVRDSFFRASYVVDTKIMKGIDKRHYNNATLVTLAEIDGESRYRVLLNDRLLGEFQNPATARDYQEVYFPLDDFRLRSGDVLSVEIMAVTNGKIPENGGTAYARGRWRGIVLK